MQESYSVAGLMLDGSLDLGVAVEATIMGVLLFGLAGLTTDHDPARVIAELAEKVERLADGESVDGLKTDRDDELGRLSRALDELEGTRQQPTAETTQSEDEQNLEQYKEYTDSVLNAIDDLFHVLDREGNLLRWNEMLPAVTGYSDAEIDNMYALDFFPTTEQDHIAEVIAEGFETGEARVESVLQKKDGETIPYEFVATRLEDPDGNPILAGIGRDISARKEQEQKLRERERELSTLMGNIPGMVYRVRNEPDWPFEFVSEGCRDLTGYEPESLEDGTVNWATEVIDDDNKRLWETVQDAIEKKEPYQVTFRIETADGDKRWVWEQGRGVFDDSGSLRALEGVIFDITEQKEREAELAQTTDFLEQTEQIASVGGWELDLRTDPPYDGEFTDELYRIHELPIGENVSMDEGLEYYHPDHRDRVGEAVECAIEAGEPYEIDARFITAKGNERWVRTSGIPIYEDGEPIKLRGALQDITEQKERELALESLQEITQGLLEKETAPEITDFVISRAAKLLEVPAIAIYLLDDETNQLEPTAFSPAFVDLCGDPVSIPIDQGDSVLWTAFVGGDRVVLNDEHIAQSSVLGASVEGGQVFPLEEYGVFITASSDVPICEKTQKLLETLVATTETALDRVESERLLRKRESELATRNQRLRRQIQVNNFIRSIHSSLIDADSRVEIERIVCNQLVDADHITFAWIGELNTNQDTLEPRAWDGDDTAYLDEISLSLTTGTEPAVVTARSGEPTVVRNVIDGLGADKWRQHALFTDLHSIISVPLTFDEFSIGVLTVYADEPNAFTELERNVFAELGESIANSINAVQTQRALQSDVVTELTIELAGDLFFTPIVTETDCQIEYEGHTVRSDDESRIFFTTAGADSAAVLAVLDRLVSVTESRLIAERKSECLFEATVTTDILPSRLARYAGQLQSLSVTDSGIELVVDVATTTNVRKFLDMLREEYSGVELLGRQNIERPMKTRQEFLDLALGELTDRQAEVLKTAYYAGFFEWPRTSTGEEIAEMLDVSQPTVNRHLRLSQQRLLERLFESHETPDHLKPT